MFKWTLHCFDHFIMFHNHTSWRCLSVLQWFPTAFRMMFKYLRMVFELFALFYSPYFPQLMPFFPLLTLLRPRDFLTISWAQKILPPNCSCCSLWWNTFPVLFFCLAPLTPQSLIRMPTPRRSLCQPVHSKESHPWNHLTLHLVFSLQIKIYSKVLNYLFYCNMPVTPSRLSPLMCNFHKRRDQKMLIYILPCSRYDARP